MEVFEEKDRFALARAIVSVAGEDEVTKQRLIGFSRRKAALFRDRPAEVDEKILRGYLVLRQKKK